MCSSLVALLLTILDPCVPTRNPPVLDAGDEAWTFALEWPGQAQYNATTPKNWNSAGAVAGTHREFGGLSFTTIYNAGHMAPRDQPEASLTMINAFISNSPLPGTEA